MGMFDYINCKYPLPEVDIEGTSLTSKELAFDNQTKDLDNTLDSYTIEEDGRISYIKYKTIKYIEPKNKKSKNISDRLGEIQREDPVTEYLKGDHLITFGNFVTKDMDKWDYSWDFQARVDEGKVTSIKLIQFEKIPNKKRKETAIAFQKKMKDYEKYRKTLRYKYCLKYLLQFKHWLRYKIITWLQKLINLLYKI